MSALLTLVPMRLRRGKWTDSSPVPVSDAPTLAAEITRRTVTAPDLARISPSRDLIVALIQDGQAQAVGHSCQSEVEALSMAATYLTDPVDGARRAMLALSGYRGMGAADVAEAVAS